MSQDDLAARLTLTCTKGPLRPTNLSNVDTSIVTVIDVREVFPSCDAFSYSLLAPYSVLMLLQHLMRCAKR